MSSTVGEPLPPADLGAAGLSLWESIVDAYSLDGRELVVLAVVCRAADDIAKLESLIAGSVTADGVGPYAGRKTAISPAVAELRLSRSAFVKLLAALNLPVDGERVGRTPASRHAKKAADARWDRKRRAEEENCG